MKSEPSNIKIDDNDPILVIPLKYVAPTCVLDPKCEYATKMFEIPEKLKKAQELLDNERD